MCNNMGIKMAHLYPQLFHLIHPKSLHIIHKKVGPKVFLHDPIHEN